MRHGRAVLHGVDAGEKGELHALGALDVGHNGKSQAVGRGTSGPGNIKRHAHDAGLAGHRGVKDPASDKELDDVDAAGKEIGHHRRGLLRRVGHLGKKTRAVAVRGRDARARRDDTRALKAPLLDQVAHGKVAVKRVAGTAHRGDSACQLLFCIVAQDVAHDKAAYWVVQTTHDIAGVARRVWLARAAEVDVHVNKTRHKVGASQVDNLGVCRDLRHRRGTHPLNLLAAGDDGHVGLRHHIAATVQKGGVDKGIGLRLFGHGLSPAVAKRSNLVNQFFNRNYAMARRTAATIRQATRAPRASDARGRRRPGTCRPRACARFPLRAQRRPTARWWSWGRRLWS